MTFASSTTQILRRHWLRFRVLSLPLHRPLYPTSRPGAPRANLLPATQLNSTFSDRLLKLNLSFPSSWVLPRLLSTRAPAPSPRRARRSPLSTPAGSRTPPSPTARATSARFPACVPKLDANRATSTGLTHLSAEVTSTSSLALAKSSRVCDAQARIYPPNANNWS